MTATLTVRIKCEYGSCDASADVQVPLVGRTLRKLRIDLTCRSTPGWHIYVGADGFLADPLEVHCRCPIHTDDALVKSEVPARKGKRRRKLS